MDNSHTLIARPSYAVTVLRDADVQRVGAIILSTLDRIGVPNQEFSRIIVYCHRVIVFDLPCLPYARAEKLVTEYALGERLTLRLDTGVIVLRQKSNGCAIVIDLLKG
jgi:hypothetical protein